MNNKAKIITAVVGLIVVGLGVSLTQTKTIDIQEPIVVEETYGVDVVEDVEVQAEEVEEIELIEVEKETEQTEEVEPNLEEIGESDTIEVVESTPVVEPTPVTETTPIAEPTAVVEEATIEAVQAVEEQATYEPAPQEQAQAEAEAPASSGQTYTTVYKGVSYTVTQEQYDRATSGRGVSTTDGIPADVFLQIQNVGVTLGSNDLTVEEFREQYKDSSLDSSTTVTWS